jgi:hypothetical protein
MKTNWGEAIQKMIIVYSGISGFMWYKIWCDIGSKITDQILVQVCRPIKHETWVFPKQGDKNDD